MSCKMRINNFIQKVFFYETPYTNLDFAISRYVFFGGIFLLVWDSNFSSYSDVPLELWEPRGLFRILHLSLIDKQQLTWLEYLWKISLLTSALGLLGRFSILTTFSLSFYILGISKGFVISDFHFHLPVLTMGILCFSNIHKHKVSLIKSFKEKPIPENNKEHWVYNLILFSIAIMYFSAGWSKLRISGISWVTDGYLTQYILDAQQYFPQDTSSFAKKFASYAISHLWLGQLMASATLALELFSPIVLIKRSWTKYFFAIWILFHLSIYFLMGIYSSIWFIPLFSIFIPWSQWLKKIPALNRTE